MRFAEGETIGRPLGASATRPPLRICIVNEFFYPDDAGGTGAVLSSLAESLRASYPNVQIDVIASSNLYRKAVSNLPAYEEWNGIHIYRVAAPSAKGLRPAQRLAANAVFSAKALFRLLRKKSYDAILIGTAPPTLVCAANAYKALTGTPYLYIIYDLDPDRAILLNVLKEDGLVAHVLRRLQRNWLHAASGVVVLGRCMREYLNRVYALPEERISTIAIGCDPVSITPLPKASRFRAVQGLTGFLVCYSGNFGRYHNFDTILDAAKRLAATDPTIQFALVGGGVQKKRVEERVEREGIRNVHLFPFVEQADYADLLASADVSLVTLEPGMEGLCVPSKFYSILASGRPTIALVSPTSEVARVVAEADCGIQLEQGDVQGLADTVLYLASNPQRAEEMGENARAVLVERYSSVHTARAYYEAIVAAVEGGVRDKSLVPSGRVADDFAPHFSRAFPLRSAGAVGSEGLEDGKAGTAP